MEIFLENLVFSVFLVQSKVKTSEKEPLLETLKAKLPFRFHLPYLNKLNYVVNSFRLPMNPMWLNHLSSPFLFDSMPFRSWISFITIWGKTTYRKGISDMLFPCMLSMVMQAGARNPNISTLDPKSPLSQTHNQFQIRAERRWSLMLYIY